MANVNLLSQVANLPEPKRADVPGAVQRFQANDLTMQRLRQQIDAQMQEDYKQQEIRDILSRSSGMEAAEQIIPIDPRAGTAMMSAYNARDRLAFDQNTQALNFLDQQRTRADDQAAQERLEAVIATLPPDQQAIARAYPKEFFGEQIKNLLAPADPLEPPKDRTRVEGADTVFEEWNPATGRYEEVSRGPRSASGGMEVSFDENGNPYISIGGPAGPGDLTTKSRNATSEALFNAEAAFSRFDGIAQALVEGTPEGGSVYDLISQPAKFAAWFTSVKDKFGLGVASAEEIQHMNSVGKVIRRTLDNLNLTLKELSGAAVSDQEFKRVSASLPNLGTLSLTDIIALVGDSPAQFVAKITDAMDTIDLARARYNWYLFNGKITSDMTRTDLAAFMNGEGDRITLDSSGMERVMQETEAELTRKLREQYGADADISEQLGVEMDRRFGLIQ